MARGVDERTFDSWRPQVERAVHAIVEHLDAPLRLRDVARVAHLSEFHFHRIFTAVMGEPVGRFITRHRLETGAMLLAYQRQRSVTDIALSCGYSSVSNFSKAFSAWFGCSPREVRQPAAKLPKGLSRLTTTTGRRFDPRSLYSLPAAEPAKVAKTLARLEASVRFETRAPLDVVCLSSAAGYEPAAINRTWVKLLRQARALGLADGPVDAWGMAHDSPTLTAQEQCRYHACVPCLPTTKVPAPLFRAVIPGGRWAVFRFSGKVTAVASHYRDLYSVWVPNSGLELDDFVAVEHYIHDAPVAGRVTYEVLLKLRSA